MNVQHLMIYIWDRVTTLQFKNSQKENVFTDRILRLTKVNIQYVIKTYWVDSLIGKSCESVLVRLAATSWDSSHLLRIKWIWKPIGFNQNSRRSRGSHRVSRSQNLSSQINVSMTLLSVELNIHQRLFQVNLGILRYIPADTESRRN